MPTVHRVKQGECLASIADKYGFADWKTIYDDPSNADFKRKRKNPSAIHAGDEIVIPDRQPNVARCGTGAHHSFRLKIPPTRLVLRLRGDDGTPYASKRYRLVIQGDTFEGTTDDQGGIDQKIPCAAEFGELTLWLGGDDDQSDGYLFPIRLGHLDPVDEVSGAQARLLNLGFGGGETEDDTRQALEAFQAAHGLEVNGTLDEATIDKLRAEHDGE